MVGLAGEGQNFDGNGMYVRFQTGGGPYTVSTGPSTLTGQPLFGNAVVASRSAPGRSTAQEPPYNSNVSCYKNQLPNLNGPAAAIGPAETVRSTQRDAAVAQRRRCRAPCRAPAAPRGRPAAPSASGQGKRQAARSGQSQPSLTDELVSRLNPFASAGKGGKP